MHTLLAGSGEPILFDTSWPKVKPTVCKMLREESVKPEEWQDLFWMVHQVCIWDDRGARMLLEELKIAIIDNITNAQGLIMMESEENSLLRVYVKQWNSYFDRCGYFPSPFFQMQNATTDRHAQEHTSGGGSSGSRGARGRTNSNEDSGVRRMMLELWSKLVFDTIQHKLQEAAMKIVQSQRNGLAFDAQLVVGVRESYVCLPDPSMMPGGGDNNLGAGGGGGGLAGLGSSSSDKLALYYNQFERKYLEATHDYYSSLCAKQMQELGVRDYIRWADQRLREEEQMAKLYLETRFNCSSVPNLTKCCVSVMVDKYKELILAEVPLDIKNYDTNQLQLIYRLMNHEDTITDGIGTILGFLQDFIITEGKADMMAEAKTIVTDPEKYVEKLLALFRRFSQLVESAFFNSTKFLTARDKAYQQVVNDTSVFCIDMPEKGGGLGPRTSSESKCPELLASYCDLLLRKSTLSKRLTVDEVESRLKDVLLVLKYVQNRDVFMRYHKSYLTKRLILETSTDSDKEENMVEWLRGVGMPSEYVGKLSRMFQDMKVSQDLNKTFKEEFIPSASDAASIAHLSDSINIKILNAGAWSRSSDKAPVSLPRELEDFIPCVEAFYKEKHNGRKLQWHHYLSNGVIKFSCPNGGKFDLEITTFQMAVLFAWNERPEAKISFESLQLATELSDVELRRTLWSLTNFPKLRRQILLSEPPVKTPHDYTSQTVLSVNPSFCLIKNGREQMRGRLSLIGRLQQSTAERRAEEENEGIVQLRILRTQEAIVKIMKMRKRLTNAQLHSELVEILKNMFLPSKKMIKEQIEWLIDNDYMKRDQSDINTFIYLA